MKWAFERLGLSITRMDSMMYKMKFDPVLGQGLVTLDVGLIDHKRIAEALDIIEEVISKGFFVHVERLR